MPKTKAICVECGRQFEFFPASTRGRYCSSKCYGDFRRKVAQEGRILNLQIRRQTKFSPLLFQLNKLTGKTDLALNILK